MYMVGEGVIVEVVDDFVFVIDYGYCVGIVIGYIG